MGRTSGVNIVLKFPVQLDTSTFIQISFRAAKPNYNLPSTIHRIGLQQDFRKRPNTGANLNLGLKLILKAATQDATIDRKVSQQIDK